MADLQPQHVSLATPDGRLRVEFRWHGDRFVQTIVVDEVEAGTSVDGGADDSWPPSPPIQQLSCQRINDSNVILGVGAAGRSHWSLSVELDGDHETGMIKFDLACRCQDEPKFVGSTYQLSDSIVLTSSHAQPMIKGQSVTIPSVRHEANRHRWEYRLNAAKN